MPKRKRSDVDSASVRRSTNACYRCKDKKIKCFFSPESPLSTCAACTKAGADCVFDITPDGIPRGAEYVASLEAKILSLEERLRTTHQGPYNVERIDRSNPSHETPGSFPVRPSESPNAIRNPAIRRAAELRHNEHQALMSPKEFNSQTIASPSVASQKTPSSQTQHKVLELASDGITIFNFISQPPITPDSEDGIPPDLPPEKVANMLLETTYIYTQGRYCIVDWVQVREWHQHRESICQAANHNDQDAQAGAYFIWMMYAIAAQLTSSPPSSPASYYARALKHLPTILSHQNLTALQALLVMIQYFYRSPGGPSIWHLVGAAMRLCVELGLHRQPKSVTGATTADPYSTELRKRLFWCAYCYDRSVSILSKRPFGIHDVDINVEFPVDIDVMCLDRDAIRDRQAMAAAGEPSPREGPISTITACLNHLRMYRLQSRIMSRFAGSNAPPLTTQEALGFLSELDQWRDRVSRCTYPPNFPQQRYESGQAAYYMTALLLLRPALSQPNVDRSLLQRCANLSADACQNEKDLCFSIQNHNSPMRVYNCFRCGLTLLQCLAIRPAILPVRTALRAINSCSGALSVYTGTLAVARSYLRLFDKLSDHFLGYDDDGDLCRPDYTLLGLLQQVTSCEPSEIPELLKSLSTEEFPRSEAHPDIRANAMDHNNAPGDMYSAPGLVVDLVTPFEILDDSLRPDLFQEDMMGFWGGSSIM